MKDDNAKNETETQCFMGCMIDTKELVRKAREEYMKAEAKRREAGDVAKKKDKTKN